MKILFVTDLYPVKDDEKLTPKTLLNFVKGFEREGVEVDVIKPNFIFNSFIRRKPFYKTAQYENVLNINYWLPFLGNITKKLNKIYHVAEDVSIIVSHMPSGSIFAHKLSKKLNRPLVCGIHVSDIDVLTKPLYSIYFKKALLSAFRDAKLLACRSCVIKKRLIELYPEFEQKIFTAYSGIPESIIVKRDDNVFNYPIKVLTCANFKKRKNIDKVIKALKGLDGFELTCIGEGIEKRKLQKLDHNVKFTGLLPHDKVLDFMRQSDIFILPSAGETFGMVYLEAMASGCITIGTENDGIDGIIVNGKNGFLTKPDAAKIREILLEIKNLNTDNIKQLRQNAFKTVCDYTQDNMNRNYLQQIFKIL